MAVRPCTTAATTRCAGSTTGVGSPSRQAARGAGAKAEEGRWRYGFDIEDELAHGECRVTEASRGGTERRETQIGIRGGTRGAFS